MADCSEATASGAWLRKMVLPLEDWPMSRSLLRNKKGIKKEKKEKHTHEVNNTCHTRKKKNGWGRDGVCQRQRERESEVGIATALWPEPQMIARSVMRMHAGRASN
jgi:hypothetical protein